MPGSRLDQFNYDDAAIVDSEADAIIRNLRSLRDQVVNAWRERAVLLSPEEQSDLHAEIKQTCDFLTDLTQNP